MAVLVARMQSNADRVEKNVLRSEELMAVVRGPTIPTHTLPVYVITQLCIHLYLTCLTDHLSMCNSTQMCHDGERLSVSVPGHSE